MKNRTIKLAFALSLAAFLCGCDSEVEMVKNGTLNGHEQTTIGRAIESVLGNVEWKYFVTEKGIEIVEAKGYPGLQMFLGDREYKGWNVSYSEKEMLSEYCLSPKRIVIQFMLYKKVDSFELSYCGSESGRAMKCDDIVDYMYFNQAKYIPMTGTCKKIAAEKAEKEAEEARKAEEKRLAEERRQKLMAEAKASVDYFTDQRDQKKYRTVKIGKQTWMGENLKFKTSSSLCYEDDEKNCERLGRYYQWDDAKNACPSGWHLPSGAEFEKLVDLVKDIETLKSTTSSGAWEGSNGTDDFAFTMLPAGRKESYSYGVFEWSGLKEKAYFWSSTENDKDGARGYENMYGSNFFKWHYFSVRCVKDIGVVRTAEETGVVRAAEEKAVEEAKNSIETFVDSRDQNKYRVVKIGNQKWMAENMRYAGPSKDSVLGVAYAQESETNLYGRLYNWDEAMKVCPTGWHLPDEHGFEMLSKAVGGDSIAGKRLKSVDHWGQNKNGTDDYSFGVLPAGSFTEGGYGNVGSSANFWVNGEESDVDGLDEPAAAAFVIESYHDAASIILVPKSLHYSVRCVMD